MKPRTYIERLSTGVNEPTVFTHRPSNRTLTLPAHMDRKERFAMRDAWMAEFVGLLVYESGLDMPRWSIEDRDGRITFVDYGA